MHNLAEHMRIARATQPASNYLSPHLETSRQVGPISGDRQERSREMLCDAQRLGASTGSGDIRPRGDRIGTSAHHNSPSILIELDGQSFHTLPPRDDRCPIDIQTGAATPAASRRRRGNLPIVYARGCCWAAFFDYSLGCSFDGSLGCAFSSRAASLGADAR